MMATGSARADGFYFSEGLGGTQIENDLGAYVDGGFSARVALGRRFGSWAVEGFLQADTLAGKDPFFGDPGGLFSYGLSARYMFGISENVEVYLRGGLHKMSLDLYGNDCCGYASLEGRGIHYGAGVQLKADVPVLAFLFWPLAFTDIGPKVKAALWLETQGAYGRLHHYPTASSLDVSSSSLLLGFGLGRDF